MEENNNRKGPGVFYAVVGVATLVVAIIGATFAYFSASTGEVGGNVIGDETQNLKGSSLTLTVSEVSFSNIATADTPEYHTLVPAWFGLADNSETLPKNATPAALTEAQAKAMLAKGCADDGYTGCHLYMITASADQDVKYANLLLNLRVDNHSGVSADPSTAYQVVDKSQWGYVVFTSSTPATGGTAGTTGTQDAVDAGTTTNLDFLSDAGAPAAIGNGVNGIDIHHNQKLDANVPVVYYLLVYVNDTNVSQNNVTTTTSGEEPDIVTTTGGDTNYVVGSYSGTVELQALGGKVRATFAS